MPKNPATLPCAGLHLIKIKSDRLSPWHADSPPRHPGGAYVRPKWRVSPPSGQRTRARAILVPAGVGQALPRAAGGQHNGSRAIGGHVLTAARNELLTRVGPGTPMGDLLRRYWQPIGGASELEKNPVKPIRLMGENLVLYKDLSGTFGLVDRHCPHRRADMSYGWVEASGIRCSYHGWRYDETGACIDQPYEDTTNPKPSKSGCEIKAYPVREVAGLLWAYMGPKPVPELPVWEPFNWQNGFREIVLADVPCNWFQAQENSIDPGALRMDARQLVEPDEGRRQDRAQASQAQVRGVRARLHLQARARGPERRGQDTGPSAASRCGRTDSISAATSNGACRSTTRTRCRWRGSSCACRRAASPMCRTACRPGKARSRARTAAGSPATSSTRTSSPGSGRARSPTARRSICVRATSASP